MLKTEDIRVRDPYIVAYKGKYYLYSATENPDFPECFPADRLNMAVYESVDLKEWSEPRVVFSYELGHSKAIVADLWAPEVHYYRGKYYAFMSFKAENDYRGTYSAVSDAPDGPFVLTSEVPLTPREMSCIDGTLYIEDGVPYIVFSRDWPFNYLESKGAFMGEIWARKLNDDLTAGIGDAFRLFASDESPISKATPDEMDWGDKIMVRYGSDAPFLNRLSDGTLFLTWSPYLNDNYVVLSAVSDNGKISGHWKHADEAVFRDNGGHAMFFTDFDGSKKMCLHAPETIGKERMCCFEVTEKNGALHVVRKV